MKAPLISIVVPVYNGENFLRAALDSALAQTCSACEVIVIDDASTDGTQEIISDFEAKSQLVRSFRISERVPAPGAWNEAVRRSTGDYFVVLAHDDVLEPGFLTRCHADLRDHPDTSLWICGHRTIDANGLELGKHPITRPGFQGPIDRKAYADQFVLGQFFLPTAAVVRRDLFERLGGFDERLKVAYDYDFFFRIGALAEVFVCDEIKIGYRMHSAQSINRFIREDNGDSDIVFEKICRGAYSHLSKEQTRTLIRELCRTRCQLFSVWLRTPRASVKRIREARRVCAEALRRWRSVDHPIARDITLGPPHFNGKLAWWLGGRNWGICLLRAVVRKLPE